MLKKATRVLGVSVIASSIALSGCATSVNDRNMRDTVQGWDEENDIPSPRTQQVIVHNDRPYVSKTPVQYRKSSESPISINATGSTLVNALSVPASAAGYTLSFTEEVNPQKTINMNLNEVGALEAARQLAMAAGYVAVINERNRTITVSSEATWVFKVPRSIFDEEAANYRVGTTTEESDTGGSATGGGDSGQSTSSEFEVSGELSPEQREDFRQSILQILANSSQEYEDARATFSWASGTITVTGGVLELNRVQTLINELVRSALTQIEVKTVIAQVRLSESQQYGIDWQDILGGSSSSLTQASLGSLGGITPDNSNFNAVITKKDATTVIRALAQKNAVSVMAAPRVMSKNNRPANIFNGSKIPFLGQVQSTVSDGGTSVSAEAQYASDGLSMSVVPSALNGNTVSLKLIPSLTDVGDFSTFQFGDEGSVLQVPETYQRQMFIDVAAQSGETIILGGTQTADRTRGESGIPGLINTTGLLSRLFGGIDNSDSREELVLLVTANIIPAPQYSALVSESI